MEDHEGAASSKKHAPVAEVMAAIAVVQKIIEVECYGLSRGIQAGLGNWLAGSLDSVSGVLRGLLLGLVAGWPSQSLTEHSAPQQRLPRVTPHSTNSDPCFRRRPVSCCCRTPMIKRSQRLAAEPCERAWGRLGATLVYCSNQDWACGAGSGPPWLPTPPQMLLLAIVVSVEPPAPWTSACLDGS